MLGRIYDASKILPPNGSEVLLFQDQVFAWSLGVYSSSEKKYVVRWDCPVLYWTLVPPRDLLFLKRESSVIRS
jgi:hypothetical protein